MGFNFRKSINLGGGLKLNLGKKSVGISAGVKGARVSVNSKGRKSATLSIPGTGISYTKTSTKKRKPNNIFDILRNRLLQIVYFLVYRFKK
nr:DUF4236 domain-containing protein [Clostridioides difficile]